MKETKQEHQTIKIWEITCKRCNHSWIPRTQEIKTCPKCRSPYWDKKRRNEK